MESIATSPRAEEISFIEVINRMEEIGVEFDVPKNLPAKIQVKWQQAMAGLHNVLFPNETAYLPGWGLGAPDEKVSITSAMTLGGYLKAVEVIILELKEYPEVQKSIANALTYLLNEIFSSGVDGAGTVCGLERLVNRILAPAEALPVLFKMLEQEYGRDRKEGIAAEIAAAIVLLPPKSKIRKQYLKTYVDKELCFEINIPQQEKIGTEILPYLVGYYKGKLDCEYANPFDAVALYLERLGVHYLGYYRTMPVNLESFKQVFIAFMEIYNLLYCNWLDLRFRDMMEQVIELNDSKLDEWIRMQIKNKLDPEIIQELKRYKDLAKFLP